MLQYYTVGMPFLDTHGDTSLGQPLDLTKDLLSVGENKGQVLDFS
mgnify:CR=1 FL=1